MKNVIKAVSTLLVASAFASSFSFAGNIFEEKIVPVSKGKIETYYYDLNFEDMLRLIKQDLSEGRSLGDKAKPSMLTPYFVRAENVAGANQFVENSFANNTQVCLNILAIRVPKSTTIGGVSSASSSRNCATGYAPTSRPNAYTIYSTLMKLKPYSENITFKIGVLRDNVSNVPQNETWGLALYDEAGNGGRVQEMVVVQTTYF